MAPSKFDEYAYKTARDIIYIHGGMGKAARMQRMQAPTCTAAKADLRAWDGMSVTTQKRPCASSVR